jgi:hypothetical protein
MNGESCESCKFFARWNQSREDGTCYRYPPGNGITKRPKVSTEEWCGEYQPMPPIAEDKN